MVRRGIEAGVPMLTRQRRLRSMAPQTKHDLEDTTTLGPQAWSVASLPQDVHGLSGLRGNHGGEAIAGLETRVGGGCEFCEAPMQGEEDATARQRDLVDLLAREVGSLVHGKLQNDRRFQVRQPCL